VTSEDFGQSRTVPGVLIKYLDSLERLGIQVHPTVEFAKKHFNSEYGKTECWHVLGTREINGEQPCVYIGFKEYVTRDYFRDLFERQDVEGMLDAMHKFTVKNGDTILIRGGTPHAIGAGCFMLEIQEPSDYTMRAETCVKGEKLSPEQIHYGIGTDNMLNCFDYSGKTREQTKKLCFLKPKANGDITEFVGYSDTNCFKLEQVSANEYVHNKGMFTTIIVKKDGIMIYDNVQHHIKKGEKYFISALCDNIIFKDCDILICYPPKIDI